MTTINSIANLLVTACGLSESEAFEMAEHEFNVVPTYEELPEYDYDYDDSEDYWDDWEIKAMEREMYAKEVASREYLEDLMAHLDACQDVCVQLSSAHAYFSDNESAPMWLNDCLGNYKAINWTRAIVAVGCGCTFKVVSKSMTEYGTLNVWLDAVKGDKFTEELHERVNAEAIRAIWMD